MKHIDIWYHYVQSMVRSRLLALQYCPMEDNIADIFTKALPRLQLTKLWAGLQLDTARRGVLDSDLS
jgi:KUP system potassium uptake protein